MLFKFCITSYQWQKVWKNLTIIVIYQKKIWLLIAIIYIPNLFNLFKVIDAAFFVGLQGLNIRC